MCWLQFLHTHLVTPSRIDKDVLRCDRNLPYFLTLSNLDKLRNVITTYVWENLDIGYMQVPRLPIRSTCMYIHM
jgi:hypothetical protein